MKLKYLLVIIFVAGLNVVGCTIASVNGQTTKKKTVQVPSVQYTCTMHPEVLKDKPGNCPKCGMKLVEKKDHNMGNGRPASDSIIMKPKHVKLRNDSISRINNQMQGADFACLYEVPMQ